MPCFYPLKAYQSTAIRSANGKREISFKPPSYPAAAIQLPCGQCSGCRLKRSSEWATRIMHEAMLHSSNCFITLTYSDLHVPHDRSLRVRDFQNFMKRLRKKYRAGIRFFHCGEYGDQFGRPHYHACVFGLDFADKVLFQQRNGYDLYVSQSLQELWPFGHSSVGSLTFESAAYVARYSLKKITGKQADDHYHWVDYATGEIFYRKPEYCTMSRRPGIGKPWLEQYGRTTFDHDYVVIEGRKLPPPKFYDSQFELLYPEEFVQLKKQRKFNAMKYVDNNTPERLHVREQIALARIDLLKRQL